MNKCKHPPIESKRQIRIRIILTGLVQGVGFRPHVYKLARKLTLKGWVKNTAQGVTIELEGISETVDQFLPKLEKSLPPHAAILSKEVLEKEPSGEKSFRILESKSTGKVVPLILPDIAVCPECLEEMNDPDNRRYKYPFINCTHCGPRFSIIKSLPYDRPNTTMSAFSMCPDCEEEYKDPDNRRFHAQPIACPECGPQVAFHKSSSTPSTCSGEDAFNAAVKSLKKGKILALKGLGGFQLVVDADNPCAVNRLRKRKKRGNKPFAVMFPDLGYAKQAAIIPKPEQKLLKSAEAPIVLVEKTDTRFESASPGNPYLGIFLPYSPIHHLLLSLYSKPLIMTSGNLSDEPICIDNEEAFERLADIADTFLVHNRPIKRPVDDSVVRMVAGKLQVIRRARGYAPLPIQQSRNLKPTLAAGGHLKNTIAIATGQQIILSQHIGNLDTLESTMAFQAAMNDFQHLYDLQPETIVSDKHPDYFSTQFIMKEFPKKNQQSIQHHLAHVASTMAEHNINPPVLGFSWDGTGYGDDGKIWGAETFLLMKKQCQHIASILPFRLPGGEMAIHDTTRIAVSLLFDAGFKTSWDNKSRILVDMIRMQINTPDCSSMGRLFDGVSALLGLCEEVNYEGEAATLLEFKAQQSKSKKLYRYLLLSPKGKGPLRFDWRPMIRDIKTELNSGKSRSLIARKFHNTLADFIVEIARLSGETRVILTGGCFQNKLLTEMAISKLTDSGFEIYTNELVPPNDGGLAVGQVYSTLMTSNL